MRAFLLSYPIVGIFLVAWFSSDLVTWTIRTAAVRYNWLDRPSGHKQHSNPTPTLGGVAMCISFLLALGVVVRPDPVLGAILVTAGGIVITGACDDLFGVSALIKLAVLGLATAVLVLQGVSLHLLGHPLADGILTFLWIGFVSSAFNGLDNADGAAAGVGVVVGATVCAIAWATWQKDLAQLAMALTGCCLGFLRHNFNPARIFMGDSGSFFLGYIVATILTLGRWSPDPMKSYLIPLVILTVPLFDFMLILIVRGLDGKYKRWIDPIVMCGLDHTSHRLRELGLSVREAVLWLYLFSLTASGVAFSMVNSSPAHSYIIFVGFVAILVGAAGSLRWIELHRRSPQPQSMEPRAADGRVPSVHEAISL